jgi:hypothetical protein
MTEKYKPSPEEIVEQLTSKQVHEITEGFMVKNAAELVEVYLQLMDLGIFRLPIIGTHDGRVFLLASAEQNNHTTLLNHLKRSPAAYAENTINFTTSLEALTTYKPDRKPYLILSLPTGKVFYLKLGNGSDQLANYPLGETDLTELFTSEDIKLEK